MAKGLDAPVNNALSHASTFEGRISGMKAGLTELEGRMNFATGLGLVRSDMREDAGLFAEATAATRASVKELSASRQESTLDAIDQKFAAQRMDVRSENAPGVKGQLPPGPLGKGGYSEMKEPGRLPVGGEKLVADANSNGPRTKLAPTPKGNTPS